MSHESVPFYEHEYEKANAFNYAESLYRRFVRAIIRKTGLPEGSRLLDVGCGQGLFSHLFACCGMSVCGIDISPMAIRAASRAYSGQGVEFLCADATKYLSPQKFDCIFTRSCSLYNSETFKADAGVTMHLLRSLRRGGIFIFSYNSNLRGAHGRKKWRDHTCRDVEHHFSRAGARGLQVYAVNKIDTYCVGRAAFTGIVTSLNRVVMPALGVNADVVAVFNRV